MTLVEDAPVTEVAAPTEPAVTVAPSGHRPRPLVVALICMVVAFATCWSLLWLTQGPLANSWYQTRQHHLVSDLLVGRARVLPGQALGTLQIPRIGLNLVVQEGDGGVQLRSGPGHHPNTPRPGQIGNSVIVGHRHGWGSPFAAIGTLHKGDLIAFQSPRDPTHAYVFKVTKVQPSVGASDPAPFAHSNDHRLTLVTGTGGQFSDRRLVVTAVSGAPAGKQLQFGPPASPKISAVSRIANQGVALFVLGAAAFVLLLLVTRRRYSWRTVAVLATPFVVLGLLGLLLEFDVLLPPLR